MTKRAPSPVQRLALWRLAKYGAYHRRQDRERAWFGNADGGSSLSWAVAAQLLMYGWIEASDGKLSTISISAAGRTALSRVELREAA